MIITLKLAVITIMIVKIAMALIITPKIIDNPRKKLNQTTGHRKST